MLVQAFLLGWEKMIPIVDENVLKLLRVINTLNSYVWMLKPNDGLA